MLTKHLTDVIEGKSVIEQLDVSDLSVGAHQFWFNAGTNGIAQLQLIPVTVFKGQEQGPRIMVTAGIHGDELNGVLTAQELIRSLDHKQLKGTITIVPMINLTGMLNHSRDFFSSDPDSSPANLNRFFPGNPDGDAANRFVDTVWTKLLKPNADFAIDLHTQTRGAVYPLYIFADFTIPESLQMARLMSADCILDDPGDEGVLETTWNRNNIPSITVEVGMGKTTQPELIERSLTGIHNILKSFGNLEGDMTEAASKAIESKSVVSLRATQGGFVLPEVELLDKVEKGEVVAKQYNAFGELIESYVAPESGVVLSYNNDAMREAGALIVRLIM